MRFISQYSFGRVDSLAELCNSPCYTILDVVITEGCSFGLISLFPIAAHNTVHTVSVSLTVM